MEFAPRLFLQGTTRVSRASLQTAIRREQALRLESRSVCTALLKRTFGTTVPRPLDPKDGSPDMTKSELGEDSSYSQPAHKVSQNVTQEEKNHYDKLVQHSKEQQVRSPWMREGSEVPPVARQRSAGAMTKGKLLTTPSRMLKLILPLSVKDMNKDRKDVEPLALLVHPQQPLSYLERLIQSELPTIKDGNSEKIPSVHFRAEDNTADDDLRSGKLSKEESDEAPGEDQELGDGEKMLENGKIIQTGKIGGGLKKDKDADKEAERDPKHANFVRWSPSTEIGDFIRDASRGKEFSVEIEGAPEPIFVGVPSFADRTYYLRMRLRKTAKKIAGMADIKRECDALAHKSAQRVAQGGFAILVGWWYIVYRLTFETDLGWDVMEPVTYLVGLSTLIGGYMWFLYHNREVSYRSAMNFTVNKRQSKLYEQRGFDIGIWEGLVEEGNRLRREIKLVAEEYDTEYDEKKDELDEKVTKALRDERKRSDKDDDGKKDKKKDKDDEDED